MFIDHTQRPTTVSRNPLDEWSARRRDLYLTRYNTHNRQISMPTISVGERPRILWPSHTLVLRLNKIFILNLRRRSTCSIKHVLYGQDNGCKIGGLDASVSALGPTANFSGYIKAAYAPGDPNPQTHSRGNHKYLSVKSWSADHIQTS
jgi:hypothetical protein